MNLYINYLEYLNSLVRSPQVIIDVLEDAKIWGQHIPNKLNVWLFITNEMLKLELGDDHLKLINNS